MSKLTRALERRLGRFSRRTGSGGVRGKVDRVYGFANLSAQNYLATPGEGGEAGVQPFGVMTLFRLEALTTGATRYLANRLSTTTPGGWQQIIRTTNTIGGSFRTAGAFVYTPQYTFGLSDLGKIHAAISYLSPSLARQLTNRMEPGAGVAQSSYTPFVGPTQFGVFNGGSAGQGLTLIGLMTFRGAPSDLQLLGLFDRARELSDVPDIIPYANATEADIISLAPFSWLRADSVVTSGAKVVSIVDKFRAGHVLTQSNDALRMVGPTLHAAIKNQPILEMNSGQFYNSNLPPSFWKFAHDGSGVEIFHVAVQWPTAASTWATPLSTIAQLTTTRSGFAIYRGASGQAYDNVVNGSVNVISRSPGTIPVNTATVRNFRFSLAEARQYQGSILTDGSVGAWDATVAATPSSGDPELSLRLGGGSAGSYQGYEQWAETIIFNRVLTEYERETVRAYLRTRYGLGVTTITHRSSARSQLKSLPRSTKKLLGLRGAPTALISYLSSVVAGPLTGSITGLSCSVRTIISQVAGGYAAAVLFAQCSMGVQAGYDLYVGNSGIVWWQIRIAGAYANVSYQLTQADIGVPLVFTCGIDATGWSHLYVNGVEVGVSVNANNFVPAPSSAFNLFTRGGADYGSERLTILEFAGDLQPVSLAYAQAVNSATRLADKLTVPANRPPVAYYDIDKSVREVGGGLPNQVNDRAGTAHLTRFGARVRNGGYHVVSGQGEFLRSLPGGGFRGAATPYWVCWMGTFWTLSGGAIILVETVSGVTGWSLQGGLSPASVLFAQADNSGSFKLSGSTGVTAPFVAGQKTVVHGQWTGSVLKVFVDGVQIGTDSAVLTGFTPAAATSPMYVGSRNAIANAPQDTTHLGAAMGYANPTAQQIADHAAACLAAGRVVEMAGKTTRRYDIVQDVIDANGQVPSGSVDQLKSGDDLYRIGQLLEVSAYSTQLPVSPVSLEDVVTKIPADAIVAYGNPVVKEINVLRDGQVTYGVTGFGILNGYEGPPQSGYIPPDTGFFVWVGMADTGTGQTWLVDSSLFFRGTTGFTNVALVNGATAGGTMNFDLYKGQFIIVIGQHVNNALRLHFDWGGGPIQAGNDTTAVGVSSYLDNILQLGKSTHFSGGAPGSSLYGFAWGSSPGGLSFDELTNLCATIRATGRIQPIPGKTLHLWDVHQDVVDAGETVPAVLKDRIGTYNLKRVGNDVADAPAVRGLRNLGSQGYYLSPAGLPGSSSSPWWVALAVTPENQLVSASDVMVNKQNNPANGGWALVADPNNAAYRIGLNSGGGFTYASLATILPADVGVPQLLVVRHNGSGVNTFDFWYKGARVGSAVAVGAYNIATNANFAIGYRTTDNAGSTDTNTILGVSGGEAALTDADIAQMYADFATTRRVPRVAGKTTRRYDIVQDVIDAGLTAPASVVDREGSGDNLVRMGSPMMVARRVERSYSWENRPVAQAANGASVTSRWQTGLGKGIKGSALGFFVGAVFRVRGGGTGRFLSHSDGGPQSWNFYIGGGTFQAHMVDGGGVNRSSSFSFAADSKLRAVMMTFDPFGSAGLRVYHARNMVGQLLFTTGYRINAALDILPDVWGGFSNVAGNPDVELVGYTGGITVPTTDAFRAWEEACLASEDVRSIPGMSEHTWSIKVRGIDGSILDQIGDHHHYVVGAAPAVQDIYSRAWSI